MHLLQLWLSAAILIHVAIGAVLLRDAWRERRHRRSLEARLAALRPSPRPRPWTRCAAMRRPWAV